MGVVKARLPGGRIRVEQRNRVRVGDAIEVLSPNRLGLGFFARNLTDADGSAIEAASVPMALFDMDAPDDVGPGDLLRIRNQ